MPTYPIKSVTARSFGPFEVVSVDFSERLNIIVGDNGAGKSQLLKLLYATTAPLAEDGGQGSKAHLGRELAARLVGVFMPDSLGRLTNRVQGRSRAEVTVKYKGISQPLEFGFASNSRTDVTVGNRPGKKIEDTPVFLPDARTDVDLPWIRLAL